MNRCLFILITSLILLFCAESKRSFPFKEPLFVLNQKEKVEEYLPNPKLASALFAYTIGGLKGVPKSVITSHKNLYLIHLFTPSGLHLSSIFIFLTPLLTFLKFKSFNYFFALSLLLTLPPFFLDGFWAVKRVSFLRLLWLVLKKTPLKVSLFSVFILAFCLDFFFGTFKESPLSFTYSFLFVGMIFSNQKWPSIWLPLFLMLGQFIVCFFQDIPFYPLNFFIGFFLTSFFTILFPIFFMSFCFPIFCPITKWPLSLFLTLVQVGSNFLKNSPSFFISGDLLFLIFVLISSLNLKKKGIFLILFTIFTSSPLMNVTDRSTKISENFYLADEKKGIKKISRNQKGYKILYEEGWQCSYVISALGMEKNCQ